MTVHNERSNEGASLEKFARPQTRMFCKGNGNNGTRGKRIAFIVEQDTREQEEREEKCPRKERVTQF